MEGGAESIPRNEEGGLAGIDLDHTEAVGLLNTVHPEELAVLAGEKVAV